MCIELGEINGDIFFSPVTDVAKLWKSDKGEGRREEGTLNTRMLHSINS
jgi:hypothetical protein